MKSFIHAVIFLGAASISCFANTQGTEKGRQRNQNVHNDLLPMYTTNVNLRQKGEASGQSQAISDNKNTVPSVRKDSLGMQVKVQETSTDSNPTIISDNDELVHRPSKADTQTEYFVLEGVGSPDSDPTRKSSHDNSTSATRRHQAGDQSGETCKRKDEQTLDAKQKKEDKTLFTNGKCIEVPEQNQGSLPNIKNELGDTAEIKPEDTFPPMLNATKFPRELITPAPTPPFCPTVWPECLSDQPEHIISEVSKELMTFTLRLFQQLASKDSRQNLVVAPISVALALSNLMLGSGGLTRDNMLKTLYKQTKDIDCIHEAIKNLTTFDSVISASNFFYKKDLYINEEFKEQSYRFYGAKGLHLDSDNTENLNKINSWVSEKTKQRIPNLLQELPSDLQMILVNVIYYQGKWVSKFDPSHTRKETFHRPLSSVKVPMMNGYKYPLQNMRDLYLQAQVARFPLSNNCSLLILLPVAQGEDALKKMTNKLSHEVVGTLMTQLEEMPMKPIFVSLPQLKLDTSLQLNDALRTLGLNDLFEYPNLCALSNDTQLAVSDIQHRAVLNVKEDGVMAAAATTITVARTVSVFAVRRPFLFILVSDLSRVPILIGRVTDPSQ